jgi:hypothetical protein
MTHTTEQVPVQETPTTGTDPQQPPRRSRRTVLGWAAIAIGLVAAVVLVLLTITSDTAPQRIETEQTPAEPSLVGVPRSADAAERYLADHNATRPSGVPLSVDAAERYLADHNATRPNGVPLTADAAERYLADHE